ncbi:MAG TPA: type I restriction-modification enzyme R subunit C-terminal domain-containing protein, partial [Candidatus Ozemobacteraceae bacterium]|nr:type I restriction-modification enzyme R subunit C-terminal domain-containing protein [Candidatus Ozemobacteraceae bacterium]
IDMSLGDAGLDTFLKEGERVRYVDPKSGIQRLDHLEDERKYESTDIEAKITVPESNRKIIQEIARYAHDHQSLTGRFPKILIFAVNDIPHTSHADQLVSLCREIFGEGDSFVQKITGNKNVDRPLQRIREFRNRPAPKVVVSVDMLTTGVDIPALEFIVFLRPVKSRILWEQMLGRGTRRCSDINKTHFTIFDCFNGTLIDYFRDTGGFEVDMAGTRPVSISEIIENIWQNIEREYNARRLAGRLRRIEKDMSGDARDKFAKFIPDGDIGQFAQTLPDRIKNDFTAVMKLLRDKDFQDLLEHYPRAPRTFLIAPDVPDNVVSEYKIRRGEKLLLPVDYLYEFSAFIAGKSDEIEALRVLLKKPRGWSTTALEGLREALHTADFSEAELQIAHRIVHKKPLADVISMVRRAVIQQEPLFNAAERVDRALARVAPSVYAPSLTHTVGRQFNEEQKAWLALIREHLITHLTIDPEDFDRIPIFEGKGGIRRARKVFPDRFVELLAELNEAMVA